MAVWVMLIAMVEILIVLEKLIMELSLSQMDSSCGKLRFRWVPEYPKGSCLEGSPFRSP